MSLTESIKSDIASCVMAGEPLPCELTLQGLSHHYGVSQMPVRRAIDALLETGLLRRQGNGRLSVAKNLPKTTSKTPQPVAHYSDKNTVNTDTAADLDASLRDFVIQRCLTQNPQYLREQTTAEQLGVGRTALRQSFARLAGEGLLEHIPRCGWQVRAFSEVAMCDYLLVRELLELQALDLARAHFVEAELQALLQTNQPGRQKQAPSLALDLHDYWIDRCGNSYIQDFFARHGPFYNALFNYAVLDRKVKATMAQEHRDILNCLLAKDWRGARKALSVHIRDQQAAVTAAIVRLESAASIKQ